jgi:hypothetical protein
MLNMSIWRFDIQIIKCLLDVGGREGAPSLNASSVAYRCRLSVVATALLMEMKHVLKITVDMKPVSDVNYPPFAVVIVALTDSLLRDVVVF